jgi:histidine ammonia-lyase
MPVGSAGDGESSAVAGAAPGLGVAEALRRIRAQVPHLDGDREPGPDLAAAASIVHAGLLADLAPAPG